MANGILDNQTAAQPSPVTPPVAQPSAPVPTTGQPPAGMPPQPGTGQPPAGMPPQPGTGQPTMGTPKVQRDYAANPLNEADMEQVDKFTVMAAKAIHSPQTRDKILGRIKGVQHPYDEIADASLTVINRVEKEDKWDQAVMLLGGINVVSQVVEVAQAAGKIPGEVPEDHRKIIIGQTLQKYYKQKLATGEITKEQAAKDAHMIAMVGAGDQGSQLQQRLSATQSTRKMSNKALEKAAAGKLEAPRPAANPANPEMTMKEALANGQGGLLDE